MNTEKRRSDMQPPRYYRDQLITINDLEGFKNELFTELKKILRTITAQPEKRWLKSTEVRKLLSISPGTLQTMRINGTLPYTKLGGVIYYDHEDIEKLLITRKENNIQASPLS